MIRIEDDDQGFWQWACSECGFSQVGYRDAMKASEEASAHLADHLKRENRSEAETEERE